MTKKMGLMALGLSMALLSGCGSNNDDDGGNGGGSTLNTPAEVEKNIVGSWSVGCINDKGGWSETDGAIFNADGTGDHQGAEYDAPGCNPEDEVDSWGGAFTYAVGEATTGSAGEDAVELDIHSEGWDYYTMLHFNDVDKYLMADGDEDAGEGETPETRNSNFEDEADWIYIRQ